MYFHGYVLKEEHEIKNRNLRGLVKKIKAYHTFLKENPRYETEIFEIGDGIAVTKKR